MAELMKQQSVRGLRPRRHTSTGSTNPPPRAGGRAGRHWHSNRRIVPGIVAKGPTQDLGQDVTRIITRPALRCGRRNLPGPVWSIRDSGVPASRGSAAGSVGRWRSGPMPSRKRRGVSSRWPREARDHAATCSVPRGCVQPAGASPAKSTGPSTVGIMDGSEPRYYLSNAPEDTPLETLAYVGGSRWRIED